VASEQDHQSTTGCVDKIRLLDLKGWSLATHKLMLCEFGLGLEWQVTEVAPVAAPAQAMDPVQVQPHVVLPLRGVVAQRAGEASGKLDCMRQHYIS